MEPDAKIDLIGAPGQQGHGYSWEGNLTGQGEMETVSHEDSLHRMNLSFIKPFKSEATVTIDVQQLSAQQTGVTWTMDSAMPFFLFFMTDTIKTMIGMDYERGLKMLREYAETGQVNSKTEIQHVVDTPEIHYVGVTADTSIAQIGESMQQTMPAVYRVAKENDLELTDIPAGAIYNKMDIKRQVCRYTAMIPVRQPVEPDDGIAGGTIPAGRSIKVVHTGSYHHLDNAWAAAMSYQRYNKLKPLKSQPPFEVYLNDPQTTEEQDLLTEIYIPLKT